VGQRAEGSKLDDLEQDLTLIEKTFLSLTTRGFHHVAYNEWGKKDRAQTVICVHGLTRNSRDFDALAQALEQDRRVVCPDIVGRGRSDWLADKQQYTFATYCGDMVALMARLGNETFDWVGTSMGGFVGMFLAAQPNSPIRRLVLNDAGAFVPKSAPQRMLEYVGIEQSFESLAAAEQHFRRIYKSFGPLTDVQWADLTRHSVRRRLEDRAYALTYDPDIVTPMRVPQDLNLWSVWEEIRCPVLLLRGAESDVLSKDTVERMLQRGPKTELVEFAGVGHAPALRDPNQIEVVRRWLLA
jgi:pimeloyl-ACP methyl ester carboxylesterase